MMDSGRGTGQETINILMPSHLNIFKITNTIIYVNLNSEETINSHHVYKKTKC